MDQRDINQHTEAKSNGRNNEQLRPYKGCLRGLLSADNG